MYTDNHQKLSIQLEHFNIEYFNINYSLTSFNSNIFCMIGITNAAVFPDPVLALTNMSLPSNKSGIARS